MFAVFLDTVPGASLSRDLVVAHCEHLQRLDDAGLLVAAGPFADKLGGIVLTRHATRDEAEADARRDPFVTAGARTFRVRAWEHAHAGNGWLAGMPARPEGAFLDALKRRRTVRAFRDEPIARETLVALLDAAGRAPSAYNQQPWRPIVCTDAAVRDRLARACLDQEQVRSAPAAVVLAADPDAFLDPERAVDQEIAAGRWAPDEREARVRAARAVLADPAVRRHEAWRSAVIFGHQLLLAALSVGLDGFWLGGLDDRAVRVALGIPEGVVVAGVIGLGRAAEEALPLPREPIERLTSWDGWGARA